MTAIKKTYIGQVSTKDAIAIANNMMAHPIVRIIDGFIFVYK